MEEKNSNEIEKEKSESDKSRDGSQSTTNTKIDDANLAAKRMEDANKVKERLLEREEQLAIDRKLGGETEAGGETPKEKQLTEEETASRNRIKAVGLAGGAGWAKDMDKQDGKI